MAEAILSKDVDTIFVTTPAAGYAVGEVIQLPDGRAGVLSGLVARVSGDPAAFAVSGQFALAKTASVVILKGAPLYWDRSAGTVTPLQAVAGADFFIGTAVDDAAAAATTVVVNLNVEPVYVIDLMRDRFTTVAVGSSTIASLPGYLKFNIIATNEAEKTDAISDFSVPVTIPFIVEGRMASLDGSDNTVDMNVGIANATHATSADTIGESVFIHLNETADLNIYAESDDGTTEVAATDTTVNYVDNTFFDFAFDCRDLSDIQIYINGVNVLPATVFAIDAATGPLCLLAHIEKTTGTATGEMRVGKLALRTMDVAN